MNGFKYAKVARVALMLALAGGVPVTTPAPAVAKGVEGMVSFADLAAKVSDAVVNISAEEVVPHPASSGHVPSIAPGTPFDDLFRDFFKNHKPGDPMPQDSEPGPQNATSLGSGFVIDPSGIVITDNHVIADANKITVIFTDGRKLKAKLIGRDAKIDVAVLKVESPTPLKAVPFGDSDKLRIGDPVLAVGNPFGLGGTVTAGIVSARHRNIDSGPYDNFIQTDASINKGNSGGPLFNIDGEVIGINTAILSPSGGSIGLGFATPSDDAKPIIEQLRKFGVVRRGWLGVRIQKVDDSIAESLGLGTARGALVAGIDPNGPAGPAGLKPGDVIVKFNNVEVKDSQDLPKLVASSAVDQVVDVEIFRNGKSITEKVKLGLLPSSNKVAALEKAPPKPVDQPEVVQSLGMNLTGLTAELRKKFSISGNVHGVIVASIAPDSAAATKGVRMGDVLVEVNQSSVSTPKDVVEKVEEGQKAGKKSTLLLIANPAGDVRFVAVPDK